MQLLYKIVPQLPIDICASTHTEKILILLLPGGKRSVANKARQGLCIYIVYGHSFDSINLVAHHKQYSAKTYCIICIVFKQAETKLLYMFILQNVLYRIMKWVYIRTYFRVYRYIHVL